MVACRCLGVAACNRKRWKRSTGRGPVARRGQARGLSLPQERRDFGGEVLCNARDSEGLFSGFGTRRTNPRHNKRAVATSTGRRPVVRDSGLAESVNPCGVDPFCCGLVPQVETCGYSREAPSGQESTRNESPQRRADARAPRAALRGCCTVRTSKSRSLGRLTCGSSG